MASGCLFLLAQCPSVLISVWSCVTLSSGGLSSRAGSPSGTQTYTKGLLMHSCSQPSGTPLEESAAWNDPGLGVAVTALAGGELTVGDEFWARHGENRGDLGRILGSPRCVQRQGVRARISVAATGASAVSCRGARLVAQQLERDAVVLFGWNLGIPRWAEATNGKLLEHPAHAQPSQVVVVVPTDFGFDGRKDRDGILQEAVLQCFQERRRTVKVDLVSEDTLPQFRFRCHHTLQYLSSQVSNGNLRRAAGGLARCPPPQRRSRSPRRNFIEDVSDSDDAVHLRRPYMKRERSNE